MTGSGSASRPATAAAHEARSLTSTAPGISAR